MGGCRRPRKILGAGTVWELMGEQVHGAPARGAGAQSGDAGVSASTCSRGRACAGRGREQAREVTRGTTRGSSHAYVAPSEQPTRAASGGSCRFQDGLVSPGPRRERVRRARAVATFLFHTHFPRNFGTWFRGPEKTNLNNFSPFSVFEILLCVAFDSSSIL